MKICKNCGKYIGNSSKKCKFCGFLCDNSSKTNEENINEVGEDVLETSVSTVSQVQDKQAKEINTDTKSTIGTALSNLKYSLSFMPAMLITFGLMVVCVLAILFFADKLNNEQIARSCILMIVVFAIFLLIFLTGFVLSIIFNIMRKRRLKK